MLLPAGCGTRKGEAAFSRLNGEWRIVELGNRRLAPEETGQRLVIDAAGRKLSGSTGCNLFTGEVEAAKDGAVRFLRIASTRKACMDMRPEEELLKALNGVARFEATGETPGRVVFYGAKREKLLAAERAAP
jgi:heat shock protein HslJ